MIFRQLFDPPSSTYTYLLADESTREAVLIDPVFEQARRDAALVNELGLKLRWTVETHIHADHVTAAWLLKRRLGTSIAVGAATGAEGADRYLEDGDEILLGERALRTLATPGHTSGCVTYVLDDLSRAFTGDCLLVRGTGRTDFQGGDAATMYRSVRERIFALPDSCFLHPAHDYRGLTLTAVCEEKKFNPRLGGNVALGDFTGHMANLKLAHPKQMDIAVPANLRCGRPARDLPIEADPDWAPLNFSFAGIWEITPQALEEKLADVQVVDVREPSEFTGPLGHIAGANLIPLGELQWRADEIAREKPVVTVCRAGSRSAQAFNLLRAAGFSEVANLSGGMLRWRAEGFPVQGGRVKGISSDIDPA
ncbi:MAG TPA: MBL fold metallo-hydrolase [Rhizomicrobium sp.]|jgi:glyoxylase-like metal-dependent hydrolase (beta-lactamase superfamily II)/rhodanese-related sulfurtransferase|nr:MBL fold metallo-hydrolase [Rhizomicrobium sp.]